MRRRTADEGLGWAPWPGGAPTPTLVVEAFGEMSPGASLSAELGEEDLYSVFRSRAELMAWSSAGPRAQRSGLWGMNDAALTPGDGGGRVGWVQVGLVPGVEPASALPALLRCLEDALGRFGVLDLAALQVTGTELQPARSRAAGLQSGLNWFAAGPRFRAEARLVVDATPLDGLTGRALLARLGRLHTEPFVFGPAGDPDIAAGLPPFPGAAPIAVSVALPEATAAAVGWALAAVLEAAAGGLPGARSLTLRADLRRRGHSR